FEGLRALLVPPEKRAPFGDPERKRRHRVVTSIEFAGRWTLLRNPVAAEVTRRTPEDPPPHVGGNEARDEALETFARILLRRYGVMFRRLLEREALGVSWFELGRLYRRLEARG